MSRTISQRELRNDSAQILRSLDEGETFIITRHNVPVGELTPLRRPRFVDRQAVIAMFAGAPKLDAHSFRRDIDEVANQGIEPRA